MVGVQLRCIGSVESNTIKQKKRHEDMALYLTKFTDIIISNENKVQIYTDRN